MKKTKFLAAIIAAVLFTATFAACTTTEDEVVQPDEPATVAEENTEDTEVSEAPEAQTQDDEELGEYVVEVYGMKFDLEKATSLTGFVDDEQADITAEEAFEREQNNVAYSAGWEGVALARRSAGVSYNSVDDPDAFDAETYEIFVDEVTPNDIIKVHDGDVIDGLTVENAEFGYVFQGGDHELSMNSFDVLGEVTLTGYITSAKEDGDYAVTGDISFMPDSPESLFFSSRLGIGGSAIIMWQGDMAFYTDMNGGFRLGSVYDEDYSGLDVSLIPTDGTNNHVTVTLTDISSAESTMRAAFNMARIVEIAQA